VASTVRWSGSGKHDGKVYVRNQRLNASQVNPTGSNLTDRGQAATRTRHLGGGELFGGFMSPVGEATVKGCGVAVARSQGHSWAPTPSNGPSVNVGTLPTVPPLRPAGAAGGKARCRLMLPGEDGGVVVVRARESRAHGEGPQRDRSNQRGCGGRW
jgi:hypothetical protein